MSQINVPYYYYEKFIKKINNDCFFEWNNAIVKSDLVDSFDFYIYHNRYEVAYHMIITVKLDLLIFVNMKQGIDLIRYNLVKKGITDCIYTNY